MEQYLHLFETKAAHDAVYNGEGYNEPWVGYITADTTVTYNKFIDYKNTPGSIIYAKSNGTLKATSKEKWNSSLGTPIAVVVIPASHMPDGKCRGASLCNMSYVTPQTGTLDKDNGTALLWGTQGLDVTQLTNYTSVQGLSKLEYFGYFPSDIYNDGYYRDSTPKLVSPYASDGSQNPAYLTAGQALADMDGKANTEVLVNMSAIKDTYTSGAFENIAMNYPAAFACHLFSTIGTEQGDWYLPSMGELVYIWVRGKAINESFAAIGNSGAVQVNQDILSSSTEYSGVYPWSVNTTMGTASTENPKSTTTGSTQVKAFAAFDI